MILPVFRERSAISPQNNCAKIPTNGIPQKLMKYQRLEILMYGLNNWEHT